MDGKRLIIFMLCTLLLVGSWGVLAAQEITDEGIESYLNKYKNVIPAPEGEFSPVHQSETPVFRSPTGALTVRTMPSSFNPLTGDVAAYAWPGRQFPLWGNLSGDAPPYTYEWDFGDASPPATGSVTNPNYIYEYHTYPTVGVYYATLTVTDNDGASVSSTVRIDVAFDAHEVRVNAAIEDGLRYLYLKQNANGSWSSNYPATTTAAIIAEYCLRGHFPTNDPVADIYVGTVLKGLDYIYTRLIPQGIGMQPAGNPDSNGNGFGIRAMEYSAYSQGIIMFGLAATRSPALVATNGPANVVGRTLVDILTDMVDQLAWSQTDGGSQRGGWRYNITVPSYQSDNSAVQWAAIGLMSAEAEPWFIMAPAFVKSELQIWLNYSRNANCSYGYTGPGTSTIARTSSAIYSMYYIDNDRTTVEAEVLCAIDYVCSMWFHGSPTYGQFPGNFYAMYATKKALEDYQFVEVCSPPRNWAHDFESHLVKGLTSPTGATAWKQVTDTGDPVNDGRWNNNTLWIDVGGGYLSTAFALLILTPGVRPCTPVAVIELDPPEACPGTEICFDGRDSYIPAGCPETLEITSWEWDLDDDGVFEESGAFVCLPDGYELPPGESEWDYRVTLRVTTNEGKTGSATAMVHIGTDNNPPIAVTGGPYTACVGDTIFLDACGSYDPDFECTGDEVVEYCWDFEPDGVPDLCTDECRPDTFLVFYEEVLRTLQLRVRDTYGAWSDPAGGLVQIWSSLRELWVTEADIEFEFDPAVCETLRICATIHAGTQSPELEIDPATVDFYYDDPEDPSKRLGRFTTPVMRDGDMVTFCLTIQPPDDTLDIYVVVDPNQLIRECHEDDNVAVKTWTCGGPCPPCQTALSLVGYSSVSWADPFWTVKVQVHNGGPGVAKNVNVMMNEDVAWLTVPDAHCSYGDIPEGGTADGGMDSYTFDLTNHPGGNFNVWFDVAYEDACGNQCRVRLDPEFDPTNKESETVPVAKYALRQNYPNPFNPNTTISYQLAQHGYVDLRIYDVAGRLVRVLVSESKDPGLYAVEWNGRDRRGVQVASGIYFYRLESGSFSQTRRMVLLR
ncbi:MAG: T9SS type A sorting domain-containing protein [bacterium]|nr:MAG: T9SS type A sorting domain-containing protein [bacterium]